MKVATWVNRKRLIDAAMGKINCDLTIKNIQLVNMFSGEIYKAEVDILDGMIVQIRYEGEQPALPASKCFDGGGRYLIPGFIDSHIHIESTMMIPETFARAALPWGTTTIVTDPHEIGNVMGIEGVEFMLENAKATPMRQYVLAPACVPSNPGTEDSGAVFTEKEIGKLLDTPGVLGIAEIMDYLDVCAGDGRMASIIEEGLKRGTYLQGHAPQLSGGPLCAYLAAGPESDHECRGTDECREKVRLGMHVNLKASSLSDNLMESLKGIEGMRWLDSVSLCTDDVHAGDIYTIGHLNRVVAKAIEYGTDPLDAIRFASYNAAREYGFDDLGAVAPGYIADLQLVDALDGGRPSHVFCKGELVAENGKYIGKSYGGGFTFPNTMKIDNLTGPSDFLLKPPSPTAKTLVVYMKFDGHFNASFYEDLPVKDGYISIENDPDIAMACVCNRYGKNQKTVAPIRNFGIKRGAIASTISHDCHNLTIVYRNENDAWLAAKTLEQSGGGIVVVDDGKVIAHLPLPVAGLMSDLTIEELAPKVEVVEKAVLDQCDGKSSLLKVAIFALAVMPGSIITDKGIIKGATKEFLPQFE